VSSAQPPRSLEEQFAGEQLVVETRKHRRTALVALRGELEYARSNRHNLAVVRGTDEIQRVLKLTGVEDLLVLVEDPDDLVPPPLTS
jgi:hypothetical protein